MTGGQLFMLVTFGLVAVIEGFVVPPLNRTNLPPQLQFPELQFDLTNARPPLRDRARRRNEKRLGFPSGGSAGYLVSGGNGAYPGQGGDFNRSSLCRGGGSTRKGYNGSASVGFNSGCDCCQQSSGCYNQSCCQQQTRCCQQQQQCCQSGCQQQPSCRCPQQYSCGGGDQQPPRFPSNQTQTQQQTCYFCPCAPSYCQPVMPQQNCPCPTSSQAYPCSQADMPTNGYSNGQVHYGVYPVAPQIIYSSGAKLKPSWKQAVNIGFTMMLWLLCQ